MTPDSVAYKDSLPFEQAFDPIRFFNGHMIAHGMFVDRFGLVRRRFDVKMECFAKNDQTQLNEFFTYDDGETEQRIWTIYKKTDHDYTAKTDDVDGFALATTNGPVFNLKYDFYLNMFGRRVKLRFNDMMVQQSDKVVLNRAEISKFGVRIGTVFITFFKSDAPAFKHA
jgi:hypothetical protein